MKLDDLRAFVAVVDHGSISSAARHLHLSQPALTRRIQRLETSMGGALLERSAKPARVSALGLRVCEQARAVLRETAALHELLSSDGQPSGTLRIGAVQSVSDAVSLEALKALKQLFPRLRLEMGADASAELLRKVQSGHLDVAAVLLAAGASPAGKVVGRRVGALRARIVASKKYPIAASPTLAQLAEHPWVLYSGSCVCRAAIQHAFEAQGHTLQIAISEHALEPQLALVAAGAGLGCASESILLRSRYRKALRPLRVKDLHIRFDIWLVHQPHLGPLTAAVRCLEEVVAQRFGQALS
jgi:DNA-binding transcriptional LysR family regulator